MGYEGIWFGLPTLPSLVAQLLAILHRERLHELVIQTGVAQQIDPVPRDRGCRVSIADVLGLPEQLRAVLGPLLQQPGLRGDAVPLRPAPLRPVGGRRGYREAEGDASAQDKISHGSLLNRFSPDGARLSRPVRRISAQRARCSGAAPWSARVPLDPLFVRGQSHLLSPKGRSGGPAAD